MAITCIRCTGSSIEGNSTFSNLSAYFGGAIHLDKSPCFTIKDASFRDTSAQLGAAINSADTSLILNSVEFIDSESTFEYVDDYSPNMLQEFIGFDES